MREIRKSFQQPQKSEIPRVVKEKAATEKIPVMPSAPQKARTKRRVELVSPLEAVEQNLQRNLYLQSPDRKRMRHEPPPSPYKAEDPVDIKNAEPVTEEMMPKKQLFH